MARWTEGRGYTLILTHPRGPDRYVRVALVHKRTLFGQAYNVREARAEDAARSGREPEALGLGRMLSWRWLGEGEAEELLRARMRTLEALGYGVLGKEKEVARGPWDWLKELVAKQLAKPSVAPVQTEGEGSQTSVETSHTRDGTASLREALERLGLEPEALVEGLATILEVDAAVLREPTPALVAGLEAELIEMLLPVWLEHPAAALREIGSRWLALPATLYEIDQALLERWLSADGPMALAIAPRFDREALALLGPEAIARLAHAAASPRIKTSAARWHERLRSRAA